MKLKHKISIKLTSSLSFSLSFCLPFFKCMYMLLFRCSTRDRLMTLEWHEVEQNAWKNQNSTNTQNWKLCLTFIFHLLRSLPHIYWKFKKQSNNRRTFRKRFLSSYFLKKFVKRVNNCLNSNMINRQMLYSVFCIGYNFIVLNLLLYFMFAVRICNCDR